MACHFSIATFMAGLVLYAQTALGHMEMSYPAPLLSKYNPNSGSLADYSMTSPLSATGSQFPCKGYAAKYLGTAQGKSVMTLAPGEKGNLTIVGGAAHGGGSCQASLSYDKGASFTVINSYVGGCPMQGTGNFDFRIPSDAAAAKDVLFAWTWFNNEGNREMYMNCAVVTISGDSSPSSEKPKEKRKGAGGSSNKERRDTAYSARPAVFVANIGNGCGVPDSVDVVFPSPGPDVVTLGSARQAAPTGNCATAAASKAASAAYVSQFSSSSPAHTTPDPTTLVTSSLPASSSSSRSANAQPSRLSPPPSVTKSTMELTVIPVVTRSLSSSANAKTTTASGTAASGGTGSKSSQTATETAAPSGTASPPSSLSGSSYTAGTSCAPEGQWNCIGGTSFQRCASGAWSVVQSLAGGTTCQAGPSASLRLVSRENGEMRGRCNGWGKVVSRRERGSCRSVRRRA